jgi:hypothetical protein
MAPVHIKQYQWFQIIEAFIKHLFSVDIYITYYLYQRAIRRFWRDNVFCLISYNKKQVQEMKNKMTYLLYVLVCSMLLCTAACKSGKVSCPTYGDTKGGAGAGMPKAGKAKSGVFPPGGTKRR